LAQSGRELPQRVPFQLSCDATRRRLRSPRRDFSARLNDWELRRTFSGAVERFWGRSTTFSALFCCSGVVNSFASLFICRFAERFLALRAVANLFFAFFYSFSAVNYFASRAVCRVDGLFWDFKKI
jgi:hypothetical protein